MTDKLKFLTYNAKGLKDQSKRDGIFYWLKKKKVDITCIQEAHCEEETIKTWEEEWKGKIYASHGKGNSRGVCMLIGENNNFSTELIDKDEEGRFIVILVTMGEHKIKVAGYYGPNKDDTTTLSNLLSILDQTEAQHTIIMGDFNFTMNPLIDKKGKTEDNNTKCRNCLLDWMEDQEMCEIWRVKHPDERTYTWRSNTKPPTFCRLDFFIVSPSIANSCHSCNIGPGVRSDHSYVKLEVHFTSPARGRGFWKLDNSLLEEEDLKKSLRKTIEDTAEDNKGTEPTLLWETIKSAIRGECISYQTKRRKKMDNTIRNLEEGIKKLEDESTQGNDNIHNNEEKLKKLRKQLEEHVETKGQWAASKYRNILYELGEKPNKFFLNRNKERSSNNVIRRLILDNGEETTDPNHIMEEQQKFYKKIYTTTLSNPNIDLEELERIQEEVEDLKVPQVHENRWEEITSEISEEELWKTIQTCADNKSPGTDGLNNNFYKAMWPYIKHHLLNSIKATLNTGNLSISQKQGIISLIPKADKDTSKLKNWRPITLLNQDYKYLAKCLANRCRKVLPDIVSPDQTGFIPGRLIGTNILKAQGILSHLREEQLEGIMMCIDFEKAFDMIEWSHISKSLRRFNFPTKLIKWIECLYNNISTCIVNNGHISQFFHPTRGVRQGCPLSPILFVIGVELLALSIKQNNSIHGINIQGEEIKISQFADDTAFYLQNNIENIKEIFRSIDKFSKISGLKINKEKTEILLMGNTNILDIHKDIQHYVKDNIKMLGIQISGNKEKMIELNYEPIIEKMKNTIQRWQKQEISIQGKIVILKTLVISKLIYIMNVLPSPKASKIKEIQDSLYSYIWNNKQGQIKRETLIGDYQDGGLKMPDLTAQNTSLKASWVKRLTEQPGNWSNYIIGKLPQKDPLYFMHSSIKYVDIPNKPHKDDFWSEALLQWCILNQNHTDMKEWTLEKIYEENIWWNSNIQVNSKVIGYQQWAKQGIKHVQHLLTDSGNWLSHQELEEKYNITTPFTTHYGIIGAIKKKWGDISKMDITGEDTIPTKLVEKLDVKRKSSQIIYWNIIKQKCAPPTTKRHKWERDTEGCIEITTWKRLLTGTRKLNVSTRMQSWSYKHMLRIMPYNTRLHVMGLSPTNKCTFCTEKEETIKHLYVECPHVQVLWESFNRAYKIKLTVKECLLGLQETAHKDKEGLYMKLHLTRHYIHTCKCVGIKPTTEGLENKIKKHYSEDLNVAKRNNSFKSFLERWGGRNTK
jgi:exonuclease III